MKTSNLTTHLPPRAMINENGLLWLDFTTGRLLGLNRLRYVRVAVEQGDSSGNVLYLIPSHSHVPNSMFKVGISGSYYFINLRSYFKKLNLCLTKKMISYSIENVNYEGKKIWMLRKNSNQTGENE